MKIAIVIGVVLLGFVGFLAHVFRRRRQIPSTSTPAERPADWNRTLDDLFAELEAGKRTSVGQPEIGWAREYEQSLLPEGVCFPKKGDVYESNEDQPVEYLTAWRAPFTGNGEAILPKGERVWIDHDPGDEKAIGAYALPVEYDRLEKRMVPAETRSAPKYNGFYFYFKTVDLHRGFTRVGTGYDGSGEPPSADGPVQVSRSADGRRGGRGPGPA